MQTWKTIPYAPDYAASTAGKIKRLTKASGTSAGRVLKPMLNPATGYREVALRISGRTMRTRVHRVIARTFLGDTNLEVNHKNGRKTDNRLCNLEYLSRRGNHDHAMTQLNAFWCGSRVPQSKLLESDIPTVWALREAGHSYAKIGQRYGVGHGAILCIIHGRSWRRESELLGKL